MSRLLTGLAQSTVAHMAVAFLAMGGWAVWANLAHPWPKPWVAGSVQGTLSAVLTLGLKRSVDGMRPRCPERVALWAPPLVASVVSAALLVAAHGVFGTPEIGRTVALPLSVSVSYIFAYNAYRYWRSEEP